MTTRINFQSGKGGFNTIIGIVMLIAFIFLFVFAAKGIFWILTVISPILLILTLIINYKVVTNFLKYIFGLYKTNLFSALLSTGLTVLFYPLVLAYLFAKALITRKVDKMIQEQEKREKGEFVDYEIIEEETLELPELRKAQKEAENEYNDLFNQ